MYNDDDDKNNHDGFILPSHPGIYQQLASA